MQEEESNMTIYVIIDTNVIISALLSRYEDTATVRLLDHIFDRTLIPVYNDDILNEYSDVLHRTKFKFSEQKIKTILEELPDPKDVVFYEVTLSVEGSYLVTGNTKHFPKKPFIVTPTEMIQIINEILSPKNNILSEGSVAYGGYR